MGDLLAHEPPGALGIEAVDHPLPVAIRVAGRAAPGRDERCRPEGAGYERGGNEGNSSGSEREARGPTADHARKCVDSGGYQAQPRFDRDQTDMRPAAAADQHLVPGGGLLEVVAEVVAELVRAHPEDLGWGG